MKRGFETTETVDFFKNKILTLAETQEKKVADCVIGWNLVRWFSLISCKKES